MTNLGNDLVAKVGRNGIKLRVSGDLSHSYAVIPGTDVGNVGLSFPTKQMAVDFAKRTNRLGWGKQVDAYEKEFPWSYRVDNWRFGYLPEKIAVKYAEEAYGDYAVKIRKKYGIKMGRYGGTKKRGWFGERLRHKVAAMGFKMKKKRQINEYNLKFRKGKCISSGDSLKEAENNRRIWEEMVPNSKFKIKKIKKKWRATTNSPTHGFVLCRVK